MDTTCSISYLIFEVNSSLLICLCTKQMDIANFCWGGVIHTNEIVQQTQNIPSDLAHLLGPKHFEVDMHFMKKGIFGGKMWGLKLKYPNLFLAF